MDIETAASTFKQHLTKLLDYYAPINVIQNRSNYYPALSDETKASIEEREKLRKEVHIQKKLNKNNEYKLLVKSTRKLINRDKKAYIENKLDKNSDPKNAWKLAESLLGMKTEKNRTN